MVRREGAGPPSRWIALRRGAGAPGVPLQGPSWPKPKVDRVLHAVNQRVGTARTPLFVRRSSPASSSPSLG